MSNAEYDGFAIYEKELEIEATYRSDGNCSCTYCYHDIAIYLTKDQTQELYEKLKEKFSD